MPLFRRNPKPLTKRQKVEMFMKVQRELFKGNPAIWREPWGVVFRLKSEEIDKKLIDYLLRIANRKE